MTLFEKVMKRLEEKAKAYGPPGAPYSTNEVLENWLPGFTIATAIKHLRHYLNSRSMKELLEAAVYLHLEHERRMREEDDGA